MKFYRVFLNYFLKYFLCLVLIVFCCILISRVAYTSLDRFAVKDSQLSLQDNAEELCQNISKMEIICKLVSQDVYFQKLVHLQGELSPKEVLNIKYASDKMSTLSSVFPLSPYSFALFRDNPTYISSGQCADDFSGYYQKLLTIKDGSVLSEEELKSELFARDGRSITFRTVDSILYSIGGLSQTMDNAILCVVHSLKDNSILEHPYVMAFVIDPNDIAKMLLAGALSDDGCVRIESGGKYLLDTSPNGYDQLSQDQYRSVSCSIDELGWTISAAVPIAIITSQYKDIRNAMIFIMVVGLLSSIALSVFFSYRQYKGLKHLVGEMDETMDGTGLKNHNEFTILGNLIGSIKENQDQYKLKLEDLTAKHQAILLENLITHGANTSEERDMLESSFPFSLDSYCVVLVRNCSVKKNLQNLCAVFISESLEERYSLPFINVHSGIGDEIFILSLPSCGAELNGIRELFQNIIWVLSEDTDNVFNVGISAVKTAPAQICEGYRQAGQVINAYSNNLLNFTKLYRLEKFDTAGQIVDLAFLNRLYNLILSEEMDGIEALFETLTEEYQKQPLHFETVKQQIFYACKNLLEDVLTQNLGDKTALKELQYSDGDFFSSMVEKILNASRLVIGLIRESKANNSNMAFDQIICYINENYLRPDLSPDLISYDTGVSKKNLYRFIKQETGDTVASFIEKIRIEKATELLYETDYSIEKIAGLVGFTALNTFYRVFSKRVGIAPGAYRNLKKSRFRPALRG